ISHSGPIWLMPALFLVGAAFASSLLAIEAILSPHQPERKIIAKLLRALANLARARADPTIASSDVETIIRTVTDSQTSAYSTLIGKPLHSDGCSPNKDYVTSILAVTDRIATFLIGGPND